MTVILQYKSVGPYNYDIIILNIEKIMLIDKIEVTVKWKDAFSLKIKICVIGKSKCFQTL